MTGPRQSPVGRAAPLPLSHGGLRGRFSPPAAGFHTVMPLVLIIALLVIAGRGLSVLGPTFLSARFGPSNLRQSPGQAPRSAGSARVAAPLSPAFTPEVQRWAPSIQRWAVEYDIPADLIAVVMQIESCGDPSVVSPSGAIGLFQVMPYHFAPEDDPYDAETNARRGLKYLSGGLSLASDDARLALAGYNGGHGVIGLPEGMWADETLRYVDWGIGLLQDVRDGLTPSPWLSAWLESGGRSLCRRAALTSAPLPAQTG